MSHDKPMPTAEDLPGQRNRDRVREDARRLIEELDAFEAEMLEYRKEYFGKHNAKDLTDPKSRWWMERAMPNPSKHRAQVERSVLTLRKSLLDIHPKFGDRE